jgi:uncharacterized protein involved in exopolysaccharide biosynthesis
MNENDMMQGEEISLFDLWEKLRDGWKAIAAGLVLGAAGAATAIVVLPQKYEAQALMRVGNIAGGVIESPDLVVQRVGAPAFRLELAEKIGDEELLADLRANATVNKNFASAAPVKGTPLIALKAEAASRELALRTVNELVAMLEKRHNELGDSLRKKVENDIAITREKLKVAERESAELEKTSVGAATLKDTQFAPVSLLTSMRVQKQAEVFGLRQQLTALESSLLPPSTQSTQPIEAPYAADKRVSPKRSLLLALGTLGGLLAGVLWVFVADAWRRAKAEREAR